MQKVMIVDDAAFMRESLRKLLTSNGLEVVGEAEDGSDAVEKYTALKPDLVTMDITMPVMDGITAIKKIMEIDPEANIVVVSAMGQEKMVRDAVYAGAKWFLVKPFNNEKVLETIQRFLS